MASDVVDIWTRRAIRDISSGPQHIPPETPGQPGSLNEATQTSSREVPARTAESSVARSQPTQLLNRPRSSSLNSSGQAVRAVCNNIEALPHKDPECQAHLISQNPGAPPNQRECYHDEGLNRPVEEKLKKANDTIANLLVREQRLRQERDEIARIKDAQIQMLKRHLRIVAGHCDRVSAMDTEQ